MSKVLTIQDISCYGQCSLTVALPLLSALGQETVILPTAVLSTHTYNFKNFTVNDLSSDFDNILNHWKNEGLKFDCLYTGYLGTKELVDHVKYIAKNYLKDNAKVIIDPAMGDKGKLYPAFNDEYVSKMKELISIADILLPNVTEAAFLVGIDYQSDYDEEYIKKLLISLSNKGCSKIVFTDVSFKKGYTGVYSYIDGKFSYYEHEKISEGYHGTGDIFASVFTGVYLSKGDIYLAIKTAADFVARCIKATIDDKDHWYGVKFEGQIKHLLNELN